MALTEEQSFLSLWWGDEPDAALPSVREAFVDWVGQADPNLTPNPNPNLTPNPNPNQRLRPSRGTRPVDWGHRAGRPTHPRDD